MTVFSVGRVWTVSLSEGHLINERLFDADLDPPPKWSVHMLPVFGDLIGAFTFDNGFETPDEGLWRLVLMNVATGELVK